MTFSDAFQITSNIQKSQEKPMKAPQGRNNRSALQREGKSHKIFICCMSQWGRKNVLRQEMTNSKCVAAFVSAAKLILWRVFWGRINDLGPAMCEKQKQ